MKRFLAFLFSFALVLGLMPGIAAADPATTQDGSTEQTGNAAQITYKGGLNPEDGSWQEGEGGGLVKISKFIEGTGLENYFDITLTVEAKEVVKDTSTAVIIVLDASNTMNSNSGTGTRLANAKAAANQFIDEFCKGEGLSADRRIGLVSFNTNAQWVIGPNLEQANASSASSLKTKVNNITTPASDSHDRFTNMEAGLQLAYNKLQTVNVANKYVIFITDGFPTTYINRDISGNLTNTSLIRGYDPYQSGNYVSNMVGTDGYFADAVSKKVCKHGTSYSDKAAIRAHELATTMKNTGNINIFSVGIDIGGQTITGYLKDEGSDFSVVDRTKSSYEIGDPDNSRAYASWLGNQIAGGPKLTEEAHRYAAGNDAQQLNNAFANILADIRAATSLPMSNAYVSDPMGGQVEFLYLYGRDGTHHQSLQGESLPDAENTANYNAVTDTISWDIMNSGLVSIVREEPSGARTVKYELKYRVRLENESSSYTDETVVKTNDGATFNYQSLNPDGSSTHNEPLAFPDPEVEGYKGSFSFKKVDESNGTALQGAVFELKHSENCTVCREAGNTVAVSPLYATSSGSDGVVSFANIPSGHDYTLLENSAPIHYQLGENAQHSVKVAYGSTTIKDGENWVTWTANGDNGAKVTNAMLQPNEVDFVVSKSLIYGNNSQAIEPQDDEFKFILTELEAITDESGIITGFQVKADGASQEITNHGQAAEFTPIVFGADNGRTEGSYYFMISEAEGDNADIKYDTNFYIVRVFVDNEGTEDQEKYGTDVDIWQLSGTDLSDLSKVTLSEPPDYSDENEVMNFTNVKSAPVTVELPAVTKKLDGDSPEGEYSFVLMDANENVIQTIINDEDGNASFEPLTFDKAGNYTYTISEVRGDNASIYYDATVYTVNIAVTAPTANSGDNYTAEASVTGPDVSATSDSVMFNNQTKNALLSFHATKIVDVNQMPEAEKYSFKLHSIERSETGAVTDSELVFTGVNDDSGLVTFSTEDDLYEGAGFTAYDGGTIEFTEPGVYFFHASEDQGDDPTMLYDSTVHELVVVVSGRENLPYYTLRVFDDGRELSPNAAPITADLFTDIDFDAIVDEYSSADGSYGSVFPHFANSTRTTDLTLEGTKTFDKKTPAEGAFSFVLKDAEGKVLETVTNDAEGMFRFSPLNLPYNSEEEADNQHVYYISELIGDEATIQYDRSVYRVTITLEDPALSDPSLPVPASVVYEKIDEGSEAQTVDLPTFENKTKPAIPATGDSPLPWVLAGIGMLALALALISSRKARRN